MPAFPYATGVAGTCASLNCQTRDIVLNEWLKTIDRLIELFEKAGRHSHLCYCCEEAKRRRQYLDEAFALFSKYFNDLWW